MKQSKSAPLPPTTHEEQAFFIAANGYSGFRSRYDTVFASLSYSHVYVIKGGPGTGKSRTMREVARAVEGRGGQAQYIYCSSDPDSLDGVILNHGEKKIALLDGTAPHTRCTPYPGVIDEITNLGEFWNSECLGEQRDEIVRLSQEKNSRYHMAYRFLAAAGTIDQAASELLAHCIDHEKLEKAVIRTLHELTPSASPKETIQYWNACSMKGKVWFSPIPSNTRIVQVDGYLGSGRYYLNALRDALRQAKRFSYLLIPSCYTDERVEGIYFPDDNLLFIEEAPTEAEKTINMRRFLKQDATSKLRQKIKQLLALHESMTDTAVSYLKEAGAYHFALEQIYGAAMDFAAKERYVSALIEKIIKQLF